MKTPALSFAEINIREMPGFEGGGFEIRGIAPGMNIIYGPNASGKSSLSRAMGLLLRCSAESTEGASLTGKLMVDGEILLIDYKPGKIVTQQNGIPVPTQSMVPESVEDRYILSLADLLHDDAEAGELTKKILREASGGYDLTEAAGKAGFKSEARKRGNIQREYGDAEESLREACRLDKELADEEEKIPELNKELEKAGDAGREIELLKKAGKYHDALEKQNATSAALADFPKGMEKLQTDSLQRLEKIDAALESAEEDKSDAEKRIEKAEGVIEKSPLESTGGIKPGLVKSLQGKLTKLETRDRDKTARAQEVNEAEVTVRKSLVDLDAAETETATIDDLTDKRTKDLLEYARDAERHRKDKEAWKKIREWLNTGEAPEDVDTLRDGIGALNDWLIRIRSPEAIVHSDQKSSTPYKNPLFFLSAGSALVFVIAGIVSSPVWFLGFLFPFLQIVWLFMGLRKKPVQPTPGHDPEESTRRYIETGLDRPESWGPGPVRDLLRNLESRYQHSRLETEKIQRWAGQKEQGVQLRQDEKALELRRSQWKEELGFDWDHSDLTVYLRVTQLKALFEARQNLDASRTVEENAILDFDNLLKEIRNEVQKYDISPPGDCELARSAVEELAHIEKDYIDAGKDLERAREDIKKEEKLINARNEERRSVFELAGLPDGQEAELKIRLEKLDDYNKEKQAHEQSTTLLNSARNELSNNPELLELDQEKLHTEKTRLEEIAAKLDTLKDSRSRLLENIEQAEKKTGTTEKLAERDRIADILRLRREQDQAAVTGDVLTRFVRQGQHQTDRTGVFSRAQNLFAKFTRGFFKLTIDDSLDVPAFRGVDTASEMGRSLDELSSGTRIQLLLAVRIAFVEHQEQGGRKLPFILDEALAISDELRAEEIIRAGMDICSEGRQFFYLTAQHDEVGKWRRLLETREMEFNEVDLAEVREFSQKERVPSQVFEPPPEVVIPDPAGMSHESYGKALQVPSIDQNAAGGSIHLWYVVEESGELHQLLNTGINLWGQLDTLVKSRNTKNMTSDSTTYRLAAAAARTLDSALKYNLVGRGKPISRQALKESDCCGTKFEEVVLLADFLVGNGEELIKALKAGEVKRFRKEKTAELKQYLEDHGFIDLQKVLSSGEISDRVRLDVYKDLETDLITGERLSWLIQQVLRKNN